MHDTAVAVRSLEARARRRRMHRRFAARRMSRVFLLAASLLTLAIILTPEPTLGPSVAVSGSPTAFGPLAIQPAWRPAGSVLLRRPDVRQPLAVRANAATALPFGLAPRSTASADSQPRESISRWHHIYTYTRRYEIRTELASRIYDASIAAGIEPELGFRLVRVESVFNPRARSAAGALGLTQLMLGTAREFEPNVTREQLLNPDVNLRIGFRYLRALIREYKGDLKLALLVYNRGPVAVQSALSMGVNPANGYDSLVMRGYRGRGILE